MATIKIEVTAGGNTMTLQKTVSGPDLTRAVAALRVIMARQGPRPNDLSGLTDTQILEMWATRVLADLKHNVRVYEANVAASAASSGVGEIGLS